MDDLSASDADKGEVEKAASFIERARHQIKKAGPLIASIAAIGAVASGFVGYWNVWKTVKTAIYPDVQSVQKEAVAKPNVAPRLSLVVLPFANLNHEPEQDYFADGITTDLTTDLGRMPGAFVIGRGTAFTYRNKQVDLKALGRDLAVRWGVQGAVQRNGDSIRVNVSLTDLATGGDVWSDRFDGDRSNLAALQDQITARLARSLNVELINAESRRGEAAKNPDATDFVMRGWAKLYGPRSKETIAQSGALFVEALRLDPTNIDAMVGNAWRLQLEVINGWTASREAGLAAALKLIDSALARRPISALAHTVKADTLRVAGRLDEALRELDTALEIDPNYAPAHAIKAFVLIIIARAREATPEALIALRLSPKDPLAYQWRFWLGHAYWHLHEFDKAVQECRRSVELNPEFFWPLADVLSIYGATGRTDEAQAALAEMKRIRPDFSIALYKRIVLPQSTNVQWRKEIDELLDGLRKAGVRED